MLLKEQLIAEINQIPDNKIPEILDVIHYFRLGLTQEKPKTNQQRPIGLAKGQFEVPASFFESLDDDLLDAFEGK